MDPRHPQRVAASFASEGATLPFVAVPSLAMVAPGDEMTHADPSVGRSAFELAPGKKRWYGIGGGHCGLLYHPSALFDEASTVQAEFLATHLLG